MRWVNIRLTIPGLISEDGQLAYRWNSWSSGAVRAAWSWVRVRL